MPLFLMVNDVKIEMNGNYLDPIFLKVVNQQRGMMHWQDEKSFNRPKSQWVITKSQLWDNLTI